MNGEHSKKNKKQDPLIRRTSISAVGRITESDIPLSKLKKDALDLSAESDSPTTLLLTREEAIRITDQAIMTALDNAWSRMVSEVGSDQSSSKSSGGTTSPQSENGVARKRGANVTHTTTTANHLTPSEQSQSAPPKKTIMGSSRPNARDKDEMKFSRRADQIIGQEAMNRKGKLLKNGAETKVMTSPVIRAEKNLHQSTGMKRTASSPPKKLKVEARTTKRVEETPDNPRKFS